MKWRMVMPRCLLAIVLGGASGVSAGDRMVAPAGPRENMPEGVPLLARDLGEALAEVGFDAAREDSFYFALITDTHVYAENERQAEGSHPIFGRPTFADLIRLFEELNQFNPRPAFVMHAGDMVHDATTEQFEAFREATARLDSAIGLHLCLGNHDANRENFRAVFPDRQPYYSFHQGPWSFVVLDSRSQGYVDRAQREWLYEKTEAGSGGPVMFFVHYPLLPHFPEDEVVGLREAVARAARPHREAWVLSGHWHFNYMTRIRHAGMKDLHQLVTTASTSVFGYETPGYRLVCLQGEKVVATLFKRVGEEVFRKDPPPQDWPVFAAPTLSAPFRLVVGGEVPEEEAYIRRQESVGFNPQVFRFVDGRGVLVYRLPLAEARQRLGAGERLCLRLEVGSDYVVETGGEENECVELFRTPSRTTKKQLTWMIPDRFDHEYLYVRITDRTPEDGLGAFVYAMSLGAEQNP